MNPVVDIVIPVHNRLEHTKQTLESLFANTPRELFKLHVVDDLSIDGTREYLLDQASGVFDLLTLNMENIGPGASRNYVCENIYNRGKFLYHSDNDVYFLPGWLQNMIVLMEWADDHSVKVLGASCHPFLQNNGEMHPPEVERRDYKIGLKDAVSGYSQMMTWETWDTYGPFDESMRGAEKKIMGSEDWAFCQKIVKDGFYVGSVEPELVVPCGKTNTYGDPATGAETFKSYHGVKVL